jgi:hypothetical protein
MGLVGEQTVMNHMGVRINPPIQFQPATHVRSFKILNVLDADMCSHLELCRWINSNSHMIRKILFTDKAHFTHDAVNNTRNSHLWDHDNPLGTVKSNYQHRFSVNM